MRKFIYTITMFIVFLGGIYGYNYLSLSKVASDKLKEDSRNLGVDINLHYKYYANTGTLVFNLIKVGEDKSMADVFRVLLQTAYALKEKYFTFIELAFKGESKFILKGEYFKALGREYKTQNPLFTMRTLPENVLDMDEKNVFSKWTGGFLGVYARQMQDFNEFNKMWYLSDISG